MNSLLGQLSGQSSATLDSLATAFAAESGADGAVIFLSDGAQLTVGGAYAVRRAAAAGLRIRVGQGVTGLVARNGHAIRIAADAPRNRLHRQLLGLADGQQVARMCLPARGLDRQLLGVVALHRGTDHPFGDGDLTRMQPLADLLGLRLQAQGLMDAVDAHRDDRTRLIAQAISAQEAERRRIAFDLHDGVSTALASMSFHLNAAEFAMPDGAPATEQIGKAKVLADLAYAQTRAAISGLHSLVLEDMGLVAAIESVVVTAPGVEADLLADPPEAFADVADHVGAALFRIAQETVTNAVKHSRAQRLTVTLRRVDDTVVLGTSDDGVGFDVRQSQGQDDGQGYGLSSLAERCALLGASLRIESIPGRGATVIVEAPIR